MEDHLSSPDNSSARRDWRGVLLVLGAIFIYLVGPPGRHLDRPGNSAEVPGWDNMLAEIGADADCGVDPRRAVFMMKPIDLNLADASVLASLKGVGPELAARIIAFRDLRGGFDRVEEITGVVGIGSRKLAGMIDAITVGGCDE